MLVRILIDPFIENVSMPNKQKRLTVTNPAVAIMIALSSFATLGADSPADQDPGPSHPVSMAEPEKPASARAESWAVHAQLTNVTQRQSRFHSPYSGTNSLEPQGRTEETTDATIYTGLRVWSGAQLWLNIEVDQGFGLSNTVGAGGFPSGEAYKVGANTPYLRLPRVFVRQTIALGGPSELIEGAANQLAGVVSADKVVLTIGKFSVTDIFDANTYAHDPRADFLNWSVIDAGPFDYAADAWGFTYGGAAEWSVGPWTWRGGVFQLSAIPNGKVTGIDFNQYMLVAEGEHRHKWVGLAGKVKVLGFMNRGRMGRYDEAVRLGRSTATVPDTSLVRRRDSRSGVTLNIEQELGANTGAFARLGLNDGGKEAFEFTEINNSVSAGLSVKGASWRRPDDTFGVALVTNGLSSAARDYFAAGGVGILIGDGRLNYAREQIVEAYYALRLGPCVSVGLDVQRIVHPAYNRDRGPLNAFAFRLHAEF